MPTSRFHLASVRVANAILKGIAFKEDISGYKRPAVYVFIEVERMHVTLLKASGSSRSAALRLFARNKIRKVQRACKRVPSMGVPSDRKASKKEKGREIDRERDKEIVYKSAARKHYDDGEESPEERDGS